MAFPSPLAASQHFGHAGSQAPLFQPPKSPASVAVSPALARSEDYFTASRKRQRGNSTHHATQPFFAETPSWSQCPTPGDRIFQSGFGQNSGLVNERYRLANGFDTPGLESTSRLEQLTVHEHEFRRRLRDEDMGNTLRTGEAPIFGPLARERNGVARIPAPPIHEPSKTWTNTAFGLVGKVFTFGTGMIKAFTFGSGAGQEHDLKQYPLVGSDLLQEGSNRIHTPIPGSWHQDEFLGDFEQDSPAFAASTETADRPQNKRRQTDRETWVVVGTPEVNDSPMSPKRKISGNTIARSNLAGRPTASRASSRRSIAPTPRRINSHVAANGSPTQHSTAPAPLSQGHNRRASIAPVRSPSSRPSFAGNGLSCMSPEAERYAKRQAKQDKAISSMGKRMEDLIRQAQEALGTKISVEGDGMDLEDEGFVDDDW